MSPGHPKLVPKVMDDWLPHSSPAVAPSSVNHPLSIHCGASKSTRPHLLRAELPMALAKVPEASLSSKVMVT